MATSSISTGCFAFKPKKVAPLNIEAIFGRAKDFQCSSTAPEYEVFSETWSKVSELIEHFHSQLYSSVFDDIIGMLNKCRDQTTQNDVISTAVLVSGVNLPDHECMFECLRRVVLERRVTEHVCLLTAQNCVTVTQAVRQLVSQLARNVSSPTIDKTLPEQFIDDFDDDDENGAVVTNLAGSSVIMPASVATMPYLVKFYQQKHQSTAILSSPRKQVKRIKRDDDVPESQQSPPIVVMFKDLESFSPSVLQDLVLICSQYRVRLPFVFVFGVSTSRTVVHRLLPQHVSACLTLTTFSCHISSRCLQQFIDQVLLSDEISFCLGGKVLRLLLDVFLYNDFSINNFISGYKYCMLEHFLSCPVSMLCRPADQLQKAVELLSQQQLEQLLQLSSVASHFDGLSQQQREKLTNRNHQLRAWVVDTLTDSLCRYRNSLVALHCLFSVTQALPGALLGRQFRELYNRYLLGELWSDEGYQRSMQLLAMMSRQELTATLVNTLQHTTDNSLRARLDGHLCAVLALDEDKAEVQLEAVEEAAERRQCVNTTLRTVTDRQSLRQKLRSLGEAQSGYKNSYELMRDRVLSDLQQYFGETIVPPQHCALHEVFVFDRVSFVRRRLVGAPRLALQTALAHPAKYLQCSCCQVGGGKGSVSAIHAQLPDLCVVYKLHVECGSLINMFDWMQSFHAIVSPDQPLDQNIQARFARAVAELQFLGFIRPTRRKTDHVARLTWGSC